MRAVSACASPRSRTGLTAVFGTRWATSTIRTSSLRPTGGRASRRRGISHGRWPDAGRPTGRWHAWGDESHAAAATPAPTGGGGGAATTAADQAAARAAGVTRGHAQLQGGTAPVSSLAGYRKG